jgi:hypothetical protein
MFGCVLQPTMPRSFMVGISNLLKSRTPQSPGPLICNDPESSNVAGKPCRTSFANAESRLESDSRRSTVQGGYVATLSSACRRRPVGPIGSPHRPRDRRGQPVGRIGPPRRHSPLTRRISPGHGRNDHRRACADRRRPARRLHRTLLPTSRGRPVAGAHGPRSGPAHGVPDRFRSRVGSPTAGSPPTPQTGGASSLPRRARSSTKPRLRPAETPPTSPPSTTWAVSSPTAPCRDHVTRTGAGSAAPPTSGSMN